MNTNNHWLSNLGLNLDKHDASEMLRLGVAFARRCGHEEIARRILIEANFRVYELPTRTLEFQTRYAEINKV